MVLLLQLLLLLPMCRAAPANTMLPSTILECKTSEHVLRVMMHLDGSMFASMDGVELLIPKKGYQP